MSESASILQILPRATKNLADKLLVNKGRLTVLVKGFTMAFFKYFTSPMQLK